MQSVYFRSPADVEEGRVVAKRAGRRRIYVPSGRKPGEPGDPCAYVAMACNRLQELSPLTRLRLLLGLLGLHMVGVAVLWLGCGFPNTGGRWRKRFKIMRKS